MRDTLRVAFDAERAEKFKQSVASQQDREAFAAEMAVPILKELAPQVSVRQIFNQIPVAPGAQVSYPMDMGTVNAWVLPNVGSVPQNIVEGEELYIPTFTVATSVEYLETYARDGRYDVAEQAMTKLKNAIITKEESCGWTVIRAAATAARTVTVAGGTTLSKALLNKMLVKMSTNNGFKTNLICCSPTRFGDIRNWTNTDIDEQTRREIWVNGGLASIWGAYIIELSSLADNEVYAFDTRYFGVMPIRQELKTRDNPLAIPKLRVGTIGWENIGFASVDDRAIVKGTV